MNSFAYSTRAPRVNEHVRPILRHNYKTRVCLLTCAIVPTGGENDDGGRWDFRRVLAAVPRLLHRDVAPARNHLVLVHPRGLPRHLLAGHVQLHVQPHHLLLDEFQVGKICFMNFDCRKNNFLQSYKRIFKLKRDKKNY